MITFYTTKCLFCTFPLNLEDHILCAYCEKSCRSPEDSESHYCVTCSNIIHNEESRCGQCLSNPPLWQSLVSFSDYQGSLKWIIKQFKYQKKIVFAPLLHRLLHSKINTLDTLEIPKAIIPMPIHWTRHWQRGFNQSFLIAELLSKSSDIVLISKGIKRTHRTPALEGLKRQQRRTVVKNAFGVSIPIPDHVAIVDDVFTTGASAESLAKALIQQGAQRVDLWVVARTPIKR